MVTLYFCITLACLILLTPSVRSSSALPFYRPYVNYPPHNYRGDIQVLYHYGIQPPGPSAYRRGYGFENGFYGNLKRNASSAVRPKPKGDSDKKDTVTYQPTSVLPPRTTVVEKRCYECAYAPMYSMYNMRRRVKVVNYPYADEGHRVGKIYVTSMEKLDDKVGGWGPCAGPIGQEQAAKSGVATSICSSNCFIRTDKNDNVFRGCYQGEHGVDPHRLGCHLQAGATYCFCKDNLCNADQAPDKAASKH